MAGSAFGGGIGQAKEGFAMHVMVLAADELEVTRAYMTVSKTAESGKLVQCSAQTVTNFGEYLVIYAASLKAADAIFVEGNPSGISRDIQLSFQDNIGHRVSPQ
jgi:hypothetical protein